MSRGKKGAVFLTGDSRARQMRVETPPTAVKPTNREAGCDARNRYLGHTSVSARHGDRPARERNSIAGVSHEKLHSINGQSIYVNKPA